MSSPTNETRTALNHLLVVCATLLITASLPYAVPALADLKAWTPEEGVPVARLFKEWGAIPEFAGAGGAYRASVGSTDAIEDALGSTVAANLGHDTRESNARHNANGHTDTHRRDHTDRRTEPNDHGDADGHADRGAEPNDSGGADGDAEPSDHGDVDGHADPSDDHADRTTDGTTDTTAQTYQINPEEYSGIDTFIDDPSGQGMAPFYDALLRTAEGNAPGITRVSHYGDSSIATDLLTSTVRARLQGKFGDAGHGFVLPARGYLPYRHKGLRHSDNDQWAVREIVRKDDRSGHYGYGGNELIALGGAWARVGTSRKGPLGTRVSRFDIYYQTRPRGGSFSVRVNKGEAQIVSTQTDELGDAVHSIPVKDGAHFIDIRKAKGGPVRLYGVVLEREQPGVVYDSLGLVGARALRLTNFNREHIASQLERRGSNLLVLGFGGNEASDNKTEEHYYEDYQKVLQTMHTNPAKTGCLVVAPLDQARRKAGRIRTMHTIPRIVAAQRRAAHEAGCAFFDTWRAMGGEGSMERWYRSRPRLAMGDFRHATPLGYEVIGNMLYKAMLAGFDEWLRKKDAR